MKRNGTRNYPFIGKSKRLKDAERIGTLELISQRNTQKMAHPIRGPVQVTFLFYRDNRRPADLANLIALPSDLLQATGIIENDSQIESHDGSRKYYDKENPRTEIIVREYIE